MSLKVLLADDNITAQKMGSKILSEAGYSVIAVSNGAAAMKKILAEKPELVILDVYMPGYTGLEVCDKVKSAPETARVPVLLTVTNMEPFNADDGNRVKADGVLIKPFEATDLLAVVHKLEEKLRPAAPVAEAEDLSAAKAPAVQEFEDASYAEWKAEAAPEETTVPRTPEMSQEVASAPALSIEELAPSEPVPIFDLNAPAESPFEVNAPPAVFGEDGPAVFDLEPAAAAIAPPEELEFTSAPRAADLDVTTAPELEVTAQASAEVSVLRDPALVTDAADMAQFVTKFGEEHPEPVPVGIAIEFPAGETDAQSVLPVPDAAVELVPPESPSPHWGDEDVRHALGFSNGAGTAAAPARAPEPAPEIESDTQLPEVSPEQPLSSPEQTLSSPEQPLSSPEAASEGETHDLTPQLVAQFAAELDAAQAERPPEPEPAPEPASEPAAEAAAAPAIDVEEQRIAEAVDRVLQRYKAELIAAIVRELNS